MDGDRDRDAAGRARNARPRDGLGRPLPRGARGEPPMPDDIQRDPAQATALAQRLLDEGRPFHAHEVLEAQWKASRVPAERAYWQGLAQLAVGLTHAARGNEEGAARLVARGRDRLAEVGAPGLVAWADAWLAGDRRPLVLPGGVGAGP